MMSFPRTAGLAGAVVVAALTLAACGGADDEPTASGPAATSAAPESTATAPSSAVQSGTAPFGPACASVPSASLAAIVDQPVATATAQTPALSTLATAVKAAGLVDTLNG